MPCWSSLFMFRAFITSGCRNQKHISRIWSWRRSSQKNMKPWNQSSLLGDSLPKNMLWTYGKKIVPQWISQASSVPSPVSCAVHHPSKNHRHPSVWLLGVLILDQSNGLLARLSSGGTYRTRRCMRCEARCRGCLGILTPDQGEYHHGRVILVPSNRKIWICWMAYMYHPMDKNHVPSINHVRFRFFEAGSV